TAPTSSSFLHRSEDATWPLSESALMSMRARLALVSVRAGLVVWTDGRCYRWWSGRQSRRTQRWVYAFGPADDPVTTARRIAARYKDLRQHHPLSALLNGTS